MRNDHGDPVDEEDLDRTDTLPMPPDVSVEPDVIDDAVPLVRVGQEEAPLRDALTARDARIEQQAAQIRQLQDDARKADEETAVLVARLREARRIIAAGEAEVARLSEELAQARARFGAIESRKSQASGGVGPSATGWHFTRLDVGEARTVALGNRTRLGRATGCELYIDSPSVSRYHALVVVDAQGAVIEDLNSTNGVYVNGRKIMRERLGDGDSITVGEAKFRVSGVAAPGT